MAKFPQKAQVATAITKFSKQDLSASHITTANFMDFQVAKSMELVPKQKVSIDHNVFVRMDALNVPTYGDVSVHNRAYFVPFRTIFPAWTDFITDAVHTYSDNVSTLVPNVPLISNSLLIELFTGSTMAIQSTNTVNEDFVYITPGGTAYGYTLTGRGSRFLKLLYSLGYRIDFNSRNNEDYYSALPLFAAAKVYYDWYYPTAYVQDSSATDIMNWLNYDQGGVGKEFHNVFTVDDLYLFVDFMDKVNYDSDYFTSAWDNPVSPNLGASSDFEINDPTISSDGVTLKSKFVGDVTSKGTPYLQDSSDITSSTKLSQYMLTALKSLNDYAKRHQISGSRALDRYLSRFGVSLTAEKLNRSLYLSEFTYNQPVDIGDVTSQSDTSAMGGEPLGAYAGKGISYGKGSSLTFSTDEYGMLIIVTTIVPRVTNTQGQDRMTMHKTRLDFYTPEFDRLGVQAISTKELIVPLNALEEYSTTDTEKQGFDYANEVFGFIPRYAEYKRGVDQITGDFILGSRNTDLSPWTMNRDLTPMLKEYGVTRLVHSRNYLLGDDSEQYNRIFNFVDDDSYDHFKILHQFRITSHFPGSSLFDNYEFEDEDKADKVNVDINGVKTN